MRLEEIARLSVADIQTRGSNCGTVIVFNIHNGGENHLKNKSSARAIPMHSEIARAGLLDYVKALPQDGPLFPGLKRRASKGGKIGARIGELFTATPQQKKIEAALLLRRLPGASPWPDSGLGYPYTRDRIGLAATRWWEDADADNQAAPDSQD